MSDTTDLAQVTPETPAEPIADTATPTQETPATEPGNSEQPAEATETAPQDDEAEKEPTPAEQRRKERNRERWRSMKDGYRAAQAEAERLRAEVQRLKGQPIDYSTIDDPDEAIAARTAQKVSERLAGDYEARAEHSQYEAQRALAESVEAMFEAGRESMPDFDQVVNERTPIHQNAVPWIVESERGAELTYYLGKNTEVARNLYAQFERNPAAALVELGRLEAKIATPSAKPVSKAPRPAPVITSGSTPPVFDANRASVDDVAAQLRKAGIIR